jgi:hypothetical protein
MITFYSLIFQTPPTWRARSLYLYPPAIGWLSYIPRALSSLFVASCDSQGYGGGIRTRLHTGAIEFVISQKIKLFLATAVRTLESYIPTFEQLC